MYVSGSQKKDEGRRCTTGRHLGIDGNGSCANKISKGRGECRGEFRTELGGLLADQRRMSLQKLRKSWRGRIARRVSWKSEEGARELWVRRGEHST